MTILLIIKLENETWKKENINIFEIIGRINKDYGNQVYIPCSFPSVDVKLTLEKNFNIIKIHTYCEDEPECSEGYLTISWKYDYNEENPVYHFSYHQEQTCDGETTKWDEMDFESTDICEVVRMVLIVMVGEDEPENWSSGKYPEDYYEESYQNWAGIFKDLENKKLCKEWD